MKNDSLFLDLEEYRNYFIAKRNQSFELARRTGRSWLCFSKFIPTCFEDLLPYISDQSIKKRITSIVEEEIGGKEGDAHFLLYKHAMERIGVTLQDHDEISILTFKTEIHQYLEKCKDKESFVVGLAFGLEIIAEENINLLMAYSSPSIKEQNILKETLFFKIHLQNEKEHIDKCWRNIHLMAKQHRLSELMLGYKVAQKFWVNFWQGVENV